MYNRCQTVHSEIQPFRGECCSAKILMFAPGFAPYAASENICNSKLALALIRRGYEVAVISMKDEGFNYGTEWVEPWLPLQSWTHEVRYPVGTQLGRVLDVAKSFAAMKYVLPGVRWAGRAFQVAVELHARQPFDLILSRSPNDIGHVPALRMARKTGLPWIANWNDPPMHLWPDPYADRLGKFTEWMSVRLLKEVMETAGCVTFPSERLMKHVIGRSPGAHPKRTAVIPHLGFYGELPSCEPRADGIFCLCHAGNLSKERCPRAFLEGLSLFVSAEKAHDHVVVEIIGVEHPEMRSLAGSFGLDGCIKFSGGLPYLDTINRLAQSDVLLVIEAPCREGIFLPSKMADYACLSKPILAVSPTQGTVRDLLSQYGGGLCADNRSADDIAGALTRLYRAWKDGVLAEYCASESLHRQFSVDSVLSIYGRLLADLCVPCVD